jgi:hypothetical protein
MTFLQQKTSGVTLVELLIGAGVFVVMMSIASTTGFMIYQSKQKIERTNELYTETRFLADRLVREIRINTIDYYEYFSHNINDYTSATNGGLTESESNEYGKNPGLYEMFFKLIPNSSDVSGKNDVSSSAFSWNGVDRGTDIDMGYFNTGADEESDNDVDEREDGYKEAALSYDLVDGDLEGRYFQDQLFLLSADGLTKTIITKVNDTSADEAFLLNDSVGEDTFGRIAMLQMVLVDTKPSGSLDGTPDTWLVHPDFDDGEGNAVFIPITPSTIDVTDFTLIISPLDDPRKAFAESIKTNGENPHIQPHVIFRIGAKLSPMRYRGIPGPNTEFSLQTAAVSRVLTNVTFPKP